MYSCWHLRRWWKWIVFVWRSQNSTPTNWKLNASLLTLTSITLLLHPEDYTDLGFPGDFFMRWSDTIAVIQGLESYKAAIWVSSACRTPRFSWNWHSCAALKWKVLFESLAAKHDTAKDTKHWMHYKRVPSDQHARSLGEYKNFIRLQRIEDVFLL